MGSAVGGLLTASLYGSWCGLRHFPHVQLLYPVAVLAAANKLGTPLLQLCSMFMYERVLW